MAIILLILLVSCSMNEINPIDNATELWGTIIQDGIVVNSLKRSKKEVDNVVEWHNNATFISEIKEGIYDIVPFVEKLSGTSIRILTKKPLESYELIYKEDYVFKVIHTDEDEVVAYDI